MMFFFPCQLSNHCLTQECPPVQGRHKFNIFDSDIEIGHDHFGFTFQKDSNQVLTIECEGLPHLMTHIHTHTLFNWCHPHSIRMLDGEYRLIPSKRTGCPCDQHSPLRPSDHAPL